ncbi:MAG TPA: hypothetical protein VML55_25695 [Planctomycetaceae bacterium]|nr:hypothetical protein [Planctomycetaceae bacterium]
MPNNLERDIRIKLGEYVTCQVGLEEFHDWLSPVLWDIEDQGEPGAADLAYSIELAIAEYSAGHMNEQELREELEQLVLYSLRTTSASADLVGDLSAPRRNTGAETVFSSSIAR